MPIPNGHTPEHPDSPTWCTKCGTFDVYFKATDCRPKEPGFDSRTEKGARNIAECLYGTFGGSKGCR